MLALEERNALTERLGECQRVVLPLHRGVQVVFDQDKLVCEVKWHKDQSFGSKGGGVE